MKSDMVDCGLVEAYVVWYHVMLSDVYSWSLMQFNEAFKNESDLKPYQTLSV